MEFYEKYFDLNWNCSQMDLQLCQLYDLLKSKHTFFKVSLLVELVEPRNHVHQTNMKWFINLLLHKINVRSDVILEAYQLFLQEQFQ